LLFVLITCAHNVSSLHCRVEITQQNAFEGLTMSITALEAALA